MQWYMRWLRQNLNQKLDAQKTPPVSSQRASHGVLNVSIFEKIDRVTTSSHSTYKYIYILVYSLMLMIFFYNGPIPSMWPRSQTASTNMHVGPWPHVGFGHMILTSTNPFGKQWYKGNMQDTAHWTHA